MFCRKCGKRLEDGARFCSKCGMDNGMYTNHEFSKNLERCDSVSDELYTDEMDEESLDMSDEFDDDINEDINENMDEDVDDGIDDDIDDDIDIENMEYKAKIPKMRSAEGTKRKQGGARQKTPKKGEGNSSLKLLIAAVLVFAAALTLVGVIVFNGFKTSKMDKFSKNVDAYERLLIQNDAVYGAYEQLLNTAKQALLDGDTGQFRSLSKQMEEAMEKVEDEAGNQQELSELKAAYTAVFEKYRITDNYQEIYDEVMGRLDEAIAARDEDASRQLKKDLESLKTNLGIENQNLVQTMINEINMMDLQRANETEQETFEEYRLLVEEYTADENYVEALKVLDSWKEMAELARERIEESESKVRESRERESRARESREAEKRKETETETESESESTQTTPPQSSSGGGYIFPGSDSRYLSASEITPLSAWEKKVARNEIYARHGRKFSDVNLQDYFNSQSWYSGTIEPDQFSESVLNDYERKNVSLIRSLE